MNNLNYNQGMEHIDKIKNFISKQKYIQLSYLFGSSATGKTGPLSDIDIALYLNPNLSRKQFFMKELLLRSELGKILKTNKLIDVVIMNETPVSLNFEIIKHGKIIFERNRDLRINIETEIMSRYLDRRYYDKRHLKNFLGKIRTRGLIKK